ncbi:hypothetical protein [Kribbella sp. NPDC004875]|uniref:hypothetical protein n=1 Tax=Kribbella sp. NPDC004875 TaxID=3364107 RepID=UPI00367D078B
MQIIENSIVGTRSAVLRLTRRAGGPRVVIFPMLHVAEPRFFRSVEARLRECDLLVVEGIHGPSPVVDGLTLTYRMMPANEASGLVVDDIPYADLGVPFVAPDLSGAEIEDGWRKLPWQHRAVAWAVVPVATIGNFFAGRRSLLSRSVEVNDLPTAEQELHGDLLEHIDELFVDRRDDRVIAALAEVVRERPDEDLQVAVVYGADHVPGILRGLYKLGYRVVDADWLMVVSADQDPEGV